MTPAAGAANDLRAQIAGTVIEPGDTDYENARRVWNGMIDLRPALIARPRSASDVAHAIRVACAEGLSIAVRGGGHNVAGLAVVDGGLVIDLSARREVEVDPIRRTVRAAGGATWADVDAASQPFGLATPGGVVSETGIAGLTLGGGMGWLRRRYGLSADNLIGAEVVTADGSILWASETDRPDLLWGLRGGGGNFGVVTMFEFQLHPVGPEVAFANVMYPIENARKILEAHERFIEADSGAISSLAVLGHVPPVDDFAPALHGRPFIAILAVHAGDVETGMAALAPLRELAPPLVDMSAAMPFVDVQKVFDAEYPTGHRYYWKSARLERLGEATIDALVEAVERAPSAHSTIDLWLNGGAMAAVPADATAFGSRAVPYLLSPEANWDDAADDDANVDWARSVLAAAGTDRAAGSYLNFPGFLEEGDALVRSSFGTSYDRLALLKAEYDPDNVFRRNQNVRPAGS